MSNGLSFSFYILYERIQIFLSTYWVKLTVHFIGHWSVVIRPENDEYVWKSRDSHYMSANCRLGSLVLTNSCLRNVCPINYLMYAIAIIMWIPTVQYTYDMCVSEICLLLMINATGNNLTAFY